MTGKATITLCDAVTGEVVRCIEEHNLVTNAMLNIFNPTQYLILNNFDYSKLFSAGFPLWNDLMAGIVLLGNNMEEDADNFMLGKDTVPIGHAGTEYSGSSPMRGTLNTNETYATENGYHFTWDFGTDKANGTIRCIGLTSKEFGNAGFGTEAQDDGAFLVLPQAIGKITAADPGGEFCYGRGQYIGTFEPNIHLFSELDTEGRLVFSRYRSPDPAKMKINTDTKTTVYWEPISETVVTPTILVSYDSYYFLNTDEMVLYYYSDVKRNGDVMTISYMGIKIADLSITESGTLELANELCDCCAVYNNHVFILFQDGLREYTKDGVLVKTHECPFSGGTHMFMYNGCLFHKTPTGIRCYSWGSTPALIANEQLYQPAYSVDTKPPYITASKILLHGIGTPPAYNRSLSYMISSYMATINNLSLPLTKTSAHTLKISYDITH